MEQEIKKKIEEEERLRIEIKKKIEEEERLKTEAREKEEKKKQSKDGCLGCLALTFIIIIIIGVVFFITINGNKEEKVPLTPFYQQEVNENSVREAVENLTGIGVDLKGNIIKIEVHSYGMTLEPIDDKIIHIYYNPVVGASRMGRAVLTAIKAMETLFENPKVAMVVIWRMIEVVDKYGTTSTVLGTRIAMDKETADKIVDWKWIRDRATLDFNTFFELAELQFIHPAIRRRL